VLEFRLLYQGSLLAASRETHPENKHALRREFHKQLKMLWSSKSPLKERLKQPIVKDFAKEPYFTDRRSVLAEKFSYHGYSFVPIVTGDLFLTCSLDILFLRPEEPSLLLRGGDIDNRIKTVFDALRIPTVEEAAGLKEKYPPIDDEKPMYCLMQDDKLVSEVKVVADYLLLLPNSFELKKNDVFLVVHVRVKPIKLVAGNIDFA